MEEWQGCLSPSCQVALVNARHHVESRGGCAVTIEDYLLALLDAEPHLLTALKVHGIDQDELIRTIQCEQPIVATLAGDGVLSSQLVYLFALAREQADTAWLDWPLLIKVLVHGAERLQGKAYVAVLEQVGQWEPQMPADPGEGSAPASEPAPPVVVTDTDWLCLAQDVAVAMMASPQSLVCLSGDRGSGKTAWLQSLLPLLQWGYVCVDLRCEREVMASREGVLPAGAGEAPVLILDNMTPGQLSVFLNRDGHLAQQLVSAFPGPILLLGHWGKDDARACADLECQLGRTVERYHLPAISAPQLLAVAVAHQPRIEKRWQVELSAGSIKCAVRLIAHDRPSPGRVLALLERTAIRVAGFAERGPVESQRIAGEEATLRRQLLVAMARHHPLSDLEEALQELSLQRAAAEVCWYERKAAGHLRRVLVEDVVAQMSRHTQAQSRFPIPVSLPSIARHGDGEPLVG